MEINNHDTEEIGIPDLTSDVYNLSAAYNCLLEVDSQLMSKEDQARFEKMKEQIFNALAECCEML